MFFLLLLNTSLFSQGGNRNDNILYPQIPLPFYIGGEIGYSFLQEDVSFVAGESNVPCVDFTTGKANGITLGVKGLMYLSPSIFVSPRLRFEDRSSKIIKEMPNEKVRGANNELNDISTQFEVRSPIYSLTFDTNIGYEILESGAYVFGGGSLGYLMGGKYNLFQVIKDDQFVYGLSGTNEIHLVKDGEFKEFNPISLDLRGGLGYMYALNNRMVINPEVFYHFPIQSILSSPFSLKQSGIFFNLGFQYNINIDTFED
ncbi:MAG: hypothetical protein IPP08_06695 [Chlorobiota bacterium]|nr:hypothetical protein [Chlorobiota bacterium]QQS65476.1 MAG: hypothetical protein IPP08_06695 [Chlorobiota bacterium]